MISNTLKRLAEKIQEKHAVIENWYAAHAEKAPPPFYCSIDIRDSGHKIVPVDSNLFPAGFNNICPEDLRTSPEVFRNIVHSFFEKSGRPYPKNVVILPESHTHNAYYIENLFYLSKIVSDAGFNVRIGWYQETTESPVHLLSDSKKELQAYRIEIRGDQLLLPDLPDFVPDFILLNNDFSSEYPKPLDAVCQPILPSHTLGWHSRKKSEHFLHYNRLAGEFAELLGIDPWLISIETEEVAPVNFLKNEGTEAVSESVARILHKTQQAYAHYQIQRKPFVFVKNNAGTYGMGIMVAHSPEELLTMNRRIRNKMSVGKNHSQIDSVVVQEGIPTATHYEKYAAEPVIYLMGCELIGGFLRSNTQRGDEDNLNSPGMVFRKLCMSDLRKPDQDLTEEELKNLPVLELVYGSIARISALAAGIELSLHARNRC